MNKHWVGREVYYISLSGHQYVAIITRVSDHSPLPIVSLIFKNNRGKYVKKHNVMPKDANLTRKVWLPYPEGQHVWCFDPLSGKNMFNPNFSE